MAERSSEDIIVFDRTDEKIRARTTETEAEWRELKSYGQINPGNTNTFSAVATGETVYVITWRKLVHRTNPYDERVVWQRLTSTEEGHGPEPPVAAVNQMLYVCGGGWEQANECWADDWPMNKFSDYCEKYDTATNQWNEVARLKRAKRLNSVIEANGLLYCIGGLAEIPQADPDVKDEPGDQVQQVQDERGLHLPEVEVYDPNNDRWDYLESMGTPRLSPALAKDANGIYALGGTHLQTIEYYHIENDTWHELNRQMAVGRMKFRACVIDNCIYIIGGDKYAKTAERLNLGAEEDEDDEPETEILSWLATIDLKEGRSMATVFMQPTIFPRPDNC